MSELKIGDIALVPVRIETIDEEDGNHWANVEIRGHRFDVQLERLRPLAAQPSEASGVICEECGTVISNEHKCYEPLTPNAGEMRLARSHDAGLHKGMSAGFNGGRRAGLEEAAQFLDALPRGKEYAQAIRALAASTPAGPCQHEWITGGNLLGEMCSRCGIDRPAENRGQR